MRIIAVLMMSLWMSGCCGVMIEDQEIVMTGQTPQSFAGAEEGKGLSYLLYVPEEYNDTRDALPLMLFLHGAGERGDDLEMLKKHGPPKQIAGGKAFPAIVVSPQCPKGVWWDVDVLSGLLDDVCARYRIDADRVYVTGLSMGGFGSWALAAKSPERFAAVAPICGGGEPEWATKIKDIPIWVFHGAADSTVPLNRSEAMVDALKAEGAEVKFTVYPGVNHDSWTQTYDNPEFYKWMFEQKK